MTAAMAFNPGSAVHTLLSLSGRLPSPAPAIKSGGRNRDDEAHRSAPALPMQDGTPARPDYVTVSPELDLRAWPRPWAGIVHDRKSIITRISPMTPMTPATTQTHAFSRCCAWHGLDRVSAVGSLWPVLWPQPALWWPPKNLAPGQAALNFSMAAASPPLQRRLAS